ncbi:Murein DD-endopeptidase MepM and murein hydrolase activator NlpD, contain LysM domain [Clostridium amylolyticum]|uniref:Murein DD-endopeptidase MepM and murein hydrolase activator NlpD, contain LysM domain n=1 Tax=Clostridium amylolyticum TaxID=1121298 RepID=A0A1M6FMW0_9CLOT|nr:peptidoglycan DD-metalloendopeptidase family protein [Clostridium amylolyticum]SHI99014.1 Murein DD-endopeptidase MepM and murein hydrolase activator NlpD, contain LysM domain [Clostridium amylolyticum]
MKDKACKKEKIKKSIMLILAFMIPYVSVYFSDIVGLFKNNTQMSSIKVLAATLNNKLQDSNDADFFVINNKPSAERNNVATKFKVLMNAKINTVKVIVNNEEAAVLYNKEEADRLIDNLKGYYLNNAKINKSTITAMDLKGNIEVKEALAYDWELDTMEGALNKLVNINKNNNLILETTAIEKHTEELSPSVSIISSSELNVGESKTQQGENGFKEIEKKIIYNNDKKVNETIIKEVIVKQPKETIITQGVRVSEENLTALLIRPSRGAISSFYGMRWGKMHKGTDFAGNIGDPVVASMDGTVKEAAFEPTYGNYIVLSHGNSIETLYGHCSELKVKSGDKVKKGDIIAAVGNTGRSTGPHLHFEVRVNGVAKDSLKYIPKTNGS